MNALEKLIEHAEEKYPHFESERGQIDIQEAKDFNEKIKTAMFYVVNFNYYDNEHIQAIIELNDLIGTKEG